MQRAVRHIANGALLYAIFYGLVWILAVKGGMLLHAAFRAGGPPDLLEGVLLPFAVSAAAAFLALAGLRLALKRLRLRLSTSEHAASHVFLATVTLLAFAGALDPVFDLSDGPMAVAIVFGAWLGVALRRRFAL